MKKPPSKKKKQIELAVLALFSLGQIIYLVFLFGGASIKEDRVSLEELTKQVESAQRVLIRKKVIQENLEKSLKDLEALRIHVPPEVDPYAWAYEYVSSRAVSVGIRLDEVKEGKDNEANKDENEPASYSVRVSMMTSYNQTVQFLEEIEEDNPLLLVKELKIETLPGNAKKHDTRLLLHWPSGFVVDEGGTQ